MAELMNQSGLEVPKPRIQRLVPYSPARRTLEAAVTDQLCRVQQKCPQ